MDSHKYAEGLKLIADYLLRQQVFHTEDRDVDVNLYFFNKDTALEALSSLASSEVPLTQKEFIGGETFVNYAQEVAPDASLNIKVNRSVALTCRPVEFEIAPEFANLGKAQEKVA